MLRAQHLCTLVFVAALAFGCIPHAAFAAMPQTNTASKPTGTSAPKKTKVVRKPRKIRQRAQNAPTPARISEIQSALAAQGVYKGQPNGKWDASTAQAMKNFQSMHGLSPTGKLDALSLQKLGLGSEIAGRAAPAPLPQNRTAGTSAGQQQTP